MTAFPRTKGAWVLAARLANLAAACLLWLAGAPVLAQTANASSSTSASILVPISLASSAALDFGNVVACASAGTVVLSPGGSRSSTGCVGLAGGASVSAASFAVTGEPNTGYSITLPASVLITNGPDTMTVDIFTSSPSVSGTLSGAGTEVIAVGATLNLDPGEAPGLYPGTFDVTVSYN